ncbi:MAG TPA: hypothetical protein VGB30_08895 [bacterium]|jgi:hypothetical protein
MALRLSRIVPAIAALVIFTLSCNSSTNSPTAPPQDNSIAQNITQAIDYDPSRKLVGFWHINLETLQAEYVNPRTTQSHINIADYLFLKEYADAVQIEVDTYSDYGPYHPPAVKLKVGLNNIFGVSAWDIRGIVIDDSDQIDLRFADGWTAMWDIGSNIPINPYLTFTVNGNSEFPDGEFSFREFILEASSNVIPPGIWYAVDVSIAGAVKSATEFPVANVNGTLRWPGDSAPVVAMVKGEQQYINSIVGLSKKFSGGPTYLNSNGQWDDYRIYEGNLNYQGGLGGGVFPLYLVAMSDQDIPTLARTNVRVDPGPFATGPATTGCAQRNYDPARTCRTPVIVSQPLHDFTVLDPPSNSGIVLTPEIRVVRLLEQDSSLAFQNPGNNFPEWTRFYKGDGVQTTPAIGDDGTIFYLEPGRGCLTAIFQDGHDRWRYQFTHETGSDLVLTSSPYGGLLILILREDGHDTGLAAVRTDGHLLWQVNFPAPMAGPTEANRLAVGPKGTLYYARPIGGIMAYDLSGNIKWVQTGKGWFNATDPVVGDDDQVFFIEQDGQMVVCINAYASPVWTYPMPPGKLAMYPSLDYSNNPFVLVETNGQKNDIYKINGVTGEVELTSMNLTIRGYTVHDPVGNYLYVYEREQTHCDDFFICRNYLGQQVWNLNTPGFTEDGAYPVIDKYNDVYVQGPDGMFVVMVY